MILCTWKEKEGLISSGEITPEETNWQKYSITAHWHRDYEHKITTVRLAGAGQ
jgi:hypothetical protein